jgi:hypothetical protein
MVADSVRIIARPHPLRSEKYTCEAPAGMPLAELLPSAPDTVHAQVNGQPWPRARWHEPLPEGVVNVYTVPQGDAGRMIGMIVIAVAAAYTGGAAASWAANAGYGAVGQGAAYAAASTITAIPGPLTVNLECC